MGLDALRWLEGPLIITRSYSANWACSSAVNNPANGVPGLAPPRRNAHSWSNTNV